MFELDDDSIVTLTDDQGNDIDFLLLDVVEYEGGDYMVLLPLDEGDEESDEDEDDVLILKVEKDGDGEKYLGIEDETVMNAVFSLFQADLNEAMAAEAEELGEDAADEE